MKRRKWAVLRAVLTLVLILAAWLWFLWRESYLFYENSGSVAGTNIYVSQLSRRAFAGEYRWDGGMDHRTDTGRRTAPSR